MSSVSWVGKCEPCFDGVGNLNQWNTCTLILKMEEFIGTKFAFESEWENDAYKRKTNQQYQKVTRDFVKVCNICWSHKESFNKKLFLGRVFEHDLTQGDREFEGTNLQMLKCARGGGGLSGGEGMLKLRSMHPYFIAVYIRRFATTAIRLPSNQRNEFDRN